MALQKGIFFILPLFVFLSLFYPPETFSQSESVLIPAEIPITSSESSGLSSDTDDPERDFFIFPIDASAPQFLVTDPMTTTLRIITSLGVVIAIVFLISWFMQRKTRFAGSHFGRILGILPIDSRRFIYLVDIMGKVIVLGVTEQNISFLCEITDKASIDGLRLKAPTSTIPGLENLFKFLKRDNSRQMDESDMVSSENLSDHKLRAQDQIKKMSDLLLRRNNKDSELDEK